MEIRNEYGQLINHCEIDEQYLAKHFVKENDVVLELGARYGAVACTVNEILSNKSNQVVVEPDIRVWETLEKNKSFNNSKFNIIKGFISKKKLGLNYVDYINSINFGDGYATSSFEDSQSQIPSYTLEEIEQKYNLKFNVLLADCEGFLETFFDENPTFYDNLRLIHFEADFPERCNYNKIRKTLAGKGFRQAVGGFQNVWLKE